MGHIVAILGVTMDIHILQESLTNSDAQTQLFEDVALKAPWQQCWNA
jgi:hypothetical protein